MKVSYKSIHQLESVAWINENICPTRPFPYPSFIVGNGFKGPGRSGSNGYYPSSSFLYSIDAFCSLTTYLIKFRMHDVIIYIIYLNRPKGSKPHMQGEVYDFNPLAAYPVHKVLVKV